MRAAAIITCAMLAFNVPSFAQTPTSPAPSTPDIVIQYRNEKLISRIIDGLTSTPAGTQISRWNSEICPDIAGIDDIHKEFIINKIKQEANLLKIRKSTLNCSTNILVIVTMDADNFIKKFIEVHPGLFGNPAYGIAHGGTLSNLRTSRPIRWINASHTTGSDGINTGMGYGGGSRISRNTREDAVLALVIVDGRQLTHISWGQLADYITMVTLARPQLSANENDPESILSIFTARDNGRIGPMLLTNQDQAVLKGLYSSDPSLDKNQQRSQIIDQMKKH